MDKNITFSLWDSVWFNVLSMHHQTHLALSQRSGLYTWVNSSKISLPWGCLLPLPSCLPPVWGTLGLWRHLLGEILWLRNIPTWRQFSLRVTSSYCLVLFVVTQAWAHRNPGFLYQLLHAWASWTLSMIQAMFPSVREKVPKHDWDRAFLLTTIHYYLLGGNQYSW